MAFLSALRGVLDEMLDVLLDVFLMSVEAFRTFFIDSIPPEKHQQNPTQHPAPLARFKWHALRHFAVSR
jgi:hypothetical protein